MVAPRTYAARGRQAVLTDPQGAPFAVIASFSGDAPDYLAENGTWIWSSLLTRDPEAGIAFYQNIFGYEVFDLQSDDGLQHAVLATDDFARARREHSASGRATPAIALAQFHSRRGRHGRGDPGRGLGGQCPRRTQGDRHGGKFAVIADPAGAPVGVMEWKDGDSKEESK